MIIISQTKDHELLARLNEDVQTLHHLLHPEIFKPYNRAAIATALEQYLAEEECSAWLAIKNNEPVGCAVFFTRESKENAFHNNIRCLYVDQMSVQPEHRKTGAGKMLLEHAENYARGLGISRVELDHWTSNTVAVAYFRKNGYRLYREKLYKVIG